MGACNDKFAWKEGDVQVIKHVKNGKVVKNPPKKRGRPKKK